MNYSSFEVQRAASKTLKQLIQVFSNRDMKLNEIVKLCKGMCSLISPQQ